MHNNADDNLSESEAISFWQAFISALLLMPLMMPFIFLSILPFALYQAWVLTILWRWFVMPVFNLPFLQLGYAYGLLLIVHLLGNSSLKTRKNEFSKSELATFLAGEIVGPACAIAIGWIVKTFLCS